MKTTTTPTTTKAAKICECGMPDCGKPTRGGRFLPGHDAKLKYSLIDQAIQGGKRAETRLEKLGWISFLEAKRAKLAAKAPKAKAPVAAPAKAAKAPAAPRGRKAKAPVAAPVEEMAPAA